MNKGHSDNPDSGQLLEIIRLQTDITRLGPDLGAVIWLVTRRAQQLTHADGAALELLDDTDMFYEAASGIAESQLGLRLNVEQSLSGHCMRTGKGVNCSDSEQDKLVDQDACRRIGMRSMIVMPLLHLGKAVGVLKVMARQPAAFSAQDMKLLELVSEQVAAAMHHATSNDVDELLHRATHDSLTGLSNRALFYDRLRQLASMATRHGERFGVLCIDMDDLKQINDTHGHQAGDKALIELARRLKLNTRLGDTVARLGGDEFAVILARVSKEADKVRAVDSFAERIRQPFLLDGKALPLDASIGAALFPNDGKDMDSLMDCADRAMYAAKRLRKMLAGKAAGER